MGHEINYWISEMNKQGIPNQHIELMKNRVLQGESEYRLYYDEVGKDTKPTLVKVSRIKGINTGWCTENRSVYELFFSATGEITTSVQNLNTSRIEANLNSLIELGREEQNEFYANAKETHLRDGLPNFNYYQNDEIYFSDATHRTVSAIMFDAPKMMGYVTNYRKNSDKYNNYLVHKNSMQKWEQLNADFKCINIIRMDKDTYDILNGKKDEYKIQLKEFPNKQLYFRFDTPIVEVNNQNMIDTKRIEEERDSIDALIQKLQQIDDYLFANSKKLGKLPLSLRLMKKMNFNLGYFLFYELYKKEVYLDIDDPSDVIGWKIQKRILNDVMVDNQPKKRWT
ncbi:hypothetical protein QC466_005133 [Bacillus cereus]|nr:hypothetical protein [Bacillus cereus]